MSSPTRSLSISQKYAPIGKIGEGTYGLVYKARIVHPGGGGAATAAPHLTSALPPTKPPGGGSSAHHTSGGVPPSSQTSSKTGSNSNTNNNTNSNTNTNSNNTSSGSAQDTFVAVKKFKSFKSCDGISPTAIREIKLLRELRNPYIVNLLDVLLDEADKSLYLVFDYAEHDLLEMIRWHHNRISYPMPAHTVKSLLWQILHGINYLHKNWIIHRDLKPSNILVTGSDKPPSDRGCVKIADFGLARLFQAPLKPFTDVDAVVVTIWYRAPELLLGAKHYTKAIDLWAIGCIFAELVTSKPLFQGQEKERKGEDRNPFQADQIDKIFRILGKPSKEQWPSVEYLQHWNQASSWQNYSNTLQDRVRGLTSAGHDLLAKLLEYDPTKRISAENALRHPYFEEEPRPQRVAFLDPNNDPYKSRPVTPLDPKKDIGWAMGSTTNANAHLSIIRSVPSMPAAIVPPLTSVPAPKRPRYNDR